MAKSVNDAVLDAALQYIEDNADLLTLCSAEPTTLTEAVTTFKLADVAIDSSDFTGPANGDTSGRKTTVNQQSGITVDSNGTITHLALVDSGTRLLTVTTTGSKAVTTSDTVTVPAHDYEIGDPT